MFEQLTGHFATCPVWLPALVGAKFLSANMQTIILKMQMHFFFSSHEC